MRLFQNGECVNKNLTSCSFPISVTGIDDAREGKGELIYSTNLVYCAIDRCSYK